MFGTSLQRIEGWKGGRRWLDEGAIFASRVVAVLASAITAAITARYLGPTGRGEYFFGVIVAGLIAQVTNYGFSSANFYYSARYPQKIRTILFLTFSIAFPVCALLTIGYFIIIHYDYMPSWKTKFSPFLIYGISVCYLLSITIPPCLIGMKRYFSMSASQILTALLGVILMLAVARLSPTVGAFGIATLITTGMLPLLCMFLLWPGSTARREPPRQESAFLREWLTYGFRAFPPLILAYLAGRGTVFAAHAGIDTAMFGVLSVAYQVFEATLAAPQSIAMVMFPTLVTSGDASVARLGKECARMSLISIGIVFLIIVTFQKILILVFGHEYQEAYNILLWYLPGFLGYSIVSICSQFLAFFRFPWTNSAVWAIGGSVGVGASFCGARWFGVSGAAAGASTGWLVMATGLTLVTVYEINKRKRLAAELSQEGAIYGR